MNITDFAQHNKEIITPDLRLGKMYARSQKVEDYSSSELSECESQSTLSPTSTVPSPSGKLIQDHKTSIKARSNLSRRKLRVRSARRESTRLRKVAPQDYAESSSSETETIRLKKTHGKVKGQMILKNSSSCKGRVAKRHYSKRAEKQAILHHSHIIQDGWFKQDSNIQQLKLHNSEKPYNSSNAHLVQEEPYMPHTNRRGPHQQLSHQRNQPTSNFQFIDPALIKLTFEGADSIDWSRPLPPDPTLLSIGKPIRIPIWEIRDFKPCDVSHDEPCELALSDYEGETEIISTPQGECQGEEQESKHPHHRLEKRHYRKRPKSTPTSNLPYRITKSRANIATPASNLTRYLPPIPEVPSRIPQARLPITSSSTTTRRNMQRSRFLLLMHLYWSQTPSCNLTDSLNREYEGEEGAPWTEAQVERMLAEALADPDPGLEAYRRRWVAARDF